MDLYPESAVLLLSGDDACRLYERLAGAGSMKWRMATVYATLLIVFPTVRLLLSAGLTETLESLEARRVSRRHVKTLASSRS